ncbi:efflux RND transporter periplasmic adaptor subunit, partial [Rhodobaculum claviforme]
MRFLSRSLMAVFLLSVTLAVLSLAAFVVMDALADRRAAPMPQRPAQERVPAVPVVTLTPGRETPVIDAFGEVHARRTLELRAPAAGRVLEVAAGLQDGADVRAGDLLVRIDPADATTARDLAATDLARAHDELAEARVAVTLAREDVVGAQLQAELRERALARQSDLATRGVGAAAASEEAEIALATARQSVVSRRQALATAEGRVAQAESALARQLIALAEAERRLADTELRAPFDGRLTGVAVVTGGLVGTNERIATLIDPDALEVRFRLSAAQAARLLEPSGAVWPAPVTVTLDLDGVPLVARGRLDRAGPAVGEGQAGRPLHAVLDGGAGLIPGDFVRVAVEEPALEDVARLPSRAVDQAGRVLVLDADARLSEVAVRVLRRQGDTVLVSAPDLAGAEVVAARSAMVG